MVSPRVAIKVLPVFAAVAAALNASPAFAEFSLTYDGYIYSLDKTNDSWYGAFQKTSWYGDQKLASGLADALQFGLGVERTKSDFGGQVLEYGPLFAYRIEQKSFVFDDRSYCLYIKETVGGSPTSAGSSCYTEPLHNVTTLLGAIVYETKPRVAIGSSQQIVPSGNVVGGSGLNFTSNLGQSLLPQFQGGTLTVSPSAVDVKESFTLDSSAGNAIDAAGNNATFGGVFSDQAGAKGRIRFTNSSFSPAIVTLTGKSTYSGPTEIEGLVAVRVGVENALPVGTQLLVGSSASSGSLASLQLADVGQTVASLSGRGDVFLGSGTLTINGGSGPIGRFFGRIDGSGDLVKEGPSSQYLNGELLFSGNTEINAGVLSINSVSRSNTTVNAGATLRGVGTFNANLTNFGTVSPGGDPGSRDSIGAMIVNGNYVQVDGGVLELEVNGSQADLLQIGNSGAVTDLAGTVRITGVPTPGAIYTGISGPTAYAGSSTANADASQVVIAAGYQFCREDDPCFKKLNGQPSVDRTKLQFGWVALDKDGKQQVTASNPKVAIDIGIQKGGPISRVVRGSGTPGSAPQPNQPTLQQTCVANTGNAAACGTAIQAPPAQPPSQNVQKVASGFDGGNAAVAAVVNNGVSGGAPIPTASGGTTGYTTNQARAAGLPADFVTVLSAVNSLPTRSAVINSLHQVTAEPYASMQSVALEAMEQFRTSALALSDGNKAIRLFTEAEACQLDDGTLVPADVTPRPSDCKTRKISQASRWSLLIDATNTQANLDGTNDLASLDYNVFQSSYGLQYDASRQWSLGGVFGYGQANLYNYEYANSSINSNTYGGGLWAIYRPGDAWKITGLLGYMNLQYDSSRQIDFGGLNRTARASWSGNGFTSALEVQYDWILSANKADRNAVRIKPNTYLSYSLHSQGDITESGADSLNLAIDGHTADSLVYGIGFTLETPLQLAHSTRLIPRLSVGYEYDFNGDSNEEHQLSASFADVPALGSLDVLGQNRGANDLNVGLSVELETSDQLSLYAGVGGSFWSNGNELNYGGGIRWRFGGAPKATIAKAQPAPAPSPEPSVAPVAEQPAAPSIRGLW